MRSSMDCRETQAKTSAQIWGNDRSGGRDCATGPAPVGCNLWQVGSRAGAPTADFVELLVLRVDLLGNGIGLATLWIQVVEPNGHAVLAR